MAYSNHFILSALCNIQTTRTNCIILRITSTISFAPQGGYKTSLYARPPRVQVFTISIRSLVKYILFDFSIPYVSPNLFLKIIQQPSGQDDSYASFDVSIPHHTKNVSAFGYILNYNKHLNSNDTPSADETSYRKMFSNNNNIRITI